MSKKNLTLVVFGSALIVAGLVANEWVLGKLASDGRIDAFSQLLIIRSFNVIAILAGVFIIVLRNSSILPKLMLSFVIMVGMVVALDALLYFSAPLLPAPLVAGMSPQAQVRYYHANEERLSWVYAENIRYAKPRQDLDLFDLAIVADSLGYRNPGNYLEAQESIDVLLLGDSFIWGTEERTVADYLRENIPLRVYSAGMAGSGIPQWQYHYQRVVDSESGVAPPEVVVLNYYSGNDITDTQVYSGLKAAKGSVDSADYFTYINYQFLAPSPDRGISIPKPPEVFFLSNMLLYGLKAGGNEAEELSLDINGESVPICLHHREPAPELLDTAILTEISMVVNKILDVNPHTQIILSYIPTSAGIYGELMSACPDYADDLARRTTNSQLLAEHAASIDIHYVDFTPQLRAHMQIANIWSEIDHFSPEGYRVYAQLLGEAVADVLGEQGMTLSEAIE